MAAIAMLFLAIGLVTAGCGASARRVAVQPTAASSISGLVLDQTDARIPGAEVRLVRMMEGSRAGDAVVRISNGAGSYTFRAVAPGEYRLSARLPGFQTMTYTGIAIEEGQLAEFDFRLQVAASSTAVRVSGTGETETVRLAPEALPPTPPPPPAPVRVGGNVAAGRLVSQVTPQYPPDARDQGIGGVVVLEATIQADGSLDDVRVISGEQSLRDPVVDAIRQWRYEPYLLNGMPVETRTTITVEFTPPEGE